MSIDSKVRRDARRRQAERARNRAEAEAAARPASTVEPHAELRDPERRLLAGIVRREGEWVLGMDGKIAGESSSAAHVLAMIMLAGELHENEGRPVRLAYSDALKDAAHAEAKAQGLEFEQFKARLAAQMSGRQEN